MGDHNYYIYILTNRNRTVLYIGVTNSLETRIHQHRSGEREGFSKRYRCNRLVYYEHFTDIENAIAREKRLKGWTRNKKDTLIDNMNPDRRDLAPEILGFPPLP